MTAVPSRLRCPRPNRQKMKLSALIKQTEIETFGFQQNEAPNFCKIHDRNQLAKYPPTEKKACACVYD